MVLRAVSTCYTETTLIAANDSFNAPSASDWSDLAASNCLRRWANLGRLSTCCCRAKFNPAASRDAQLEADLRRSPRPGAPRGGAPLRARPRPRLPRDRGSDGGPRLHPICPLLTEQGLYAFIVPG